MADIDPVVLLSFRNNLRSCRKCPLATDTNHPVPWSGPLRPTYAVLGEAPGGQESRYSEPFVGPAGIALKYAMKSAGINPAEVAFVNSVACKPVNSAIPTLQHIDACRPWARGQLAFIQPSIVISCGVIALQSIRGHDNWPKIANLHGKPLWWDNPPAPLKSIVVWPCVDEQTEALTPEGWKTQDSLSDGDLIATVDSATMQSFWAPANFHRYDYSGEMIHLDGRSSSQLLTPNHRCLIETTSGTRKVRLAQELTFRRHEFFPLLAPLVDTPTESIGLDWARLLAWYIAEGCIPYPKGGITVRIHQSLITGHVPAIRQLLQTVHADFSERNPQSDEIVFAVHGETALKLREMAPGRKVPLWVTQLPANEMRAFLEAFIDGDGCRHKRDGKSSIIQKNKECLDRLQMMVIKLGQRGIVRKQKNGCFNLQIGDKAKWAPGPDSIHKCHYQGVVWCPSTSTGFWLARREGFPFVTGNTYHPAAGLRSAKYRRLIDEDLKSLVAWVAAGKPWPEGCWICGQEVTRYTEWGIGLCDRHCARQGILWEESA